MDVRLLKQMLEDVAKWAGSRLIPAAELRVEIKEVTPNKKYIVYVLHNGEVVEEQTHAILS